MTRIERRLGLTTLTAIIVSVALFFAVGATILAVVALREVSAQSQRSCEVQSRGLAANKQILPVWEAIDFLIEPHRGLPQEPIAPLFRPAVSTIRFHLPRFLALQKMQPAGRHC